MTAPTGSSVEPRVGVWRQARTRAAVLAGNVYVVARGWRVHAAVPGLAGAGLIAAGLAVRFGVWAGFLAGGAALLWADSRL